MRPSCAQPIGSSTRCAASSPAWCARSSASISTRRRSTGTGSIASSTGVVRGPLAPRVVAQLECLEFGPAYGQPKAALCWGANGTSLFAWNSKTYPSLSKVAFAITGFRPSSSPFEPSLYRLRSPLPGNGIFRAEKKVQHVPRTTDQRSQGPSGRTTTPLSRGLSPQPQEISATAGMRGGPGRIRISNQLVMNLPPPGGTRFFQRGPVPGGAAAPASCNLFFFLQRLRAKMSHP